jgi:hypothetical protein
LGTREGPGVDDLDWLRGDSRNSSDWVEVAYRYRNTVGLCFGGVDGCGVEDRLRLDENGGGATGRREEAAA